MAVCLGIDTSNYTTSVAVYDGSRVLQERKLLSVPEGALGLRQSDALFQHVRQLPALMAGLRGQGGFARIDAVGASTTPRRVEGSYMPCFLPGETVGRCAAELLSVPFYGFSHQEGHLAAAVCSAGREDLFDRPFLAWHLSGGTTELLRVQPEGRELRAEKLGGTSDISAGQLLDRTGKLLGLAFPAGKALDQLTAGQDLGQYFAVKRQEYTFSLSGIENQIQGKVHRGESPAAVACYALDTIANAIVSVTQTAWQKWPDLPVLCCGGVASSQRLKQWFPQACFARPEYSTDNAAGAAILAWRNLTERDSKS